MSVAQGARPRLDDVGRRVEVRLANLEMNDATPLRFKCPRAREHLKRRLSPEAIEARGKHPSRFPPPRASVKPGATGCSAETERRRSRTYPATGYAASPVLKTGWATGPCRSASHDMSSVKPDGADARMS